MNGQGEMTLSLFHGGPNIYPYIAEFLVIFFYFKGLFEIWDQATKKVCFVLQGVEWKLLARHEPRDYLNPKQVAYDIPRDLSKVGVQFRWWQPEHGGQGHDQWAIDNVEILA